jgi:hypothetical protein
MFLSHRSKGKAVLRAVAQRLRKDALKCVKVRFDERVIQPEGENGN